MSSRQFLERNESTYVPFDIRRNTRSESCIVNFILLLNSISIVRLLRRFGEKDFDSVSIFSTVTRRWHERQDLPIDRSLNKMFE